MLSGDPDSSAFSVLLIFNLFFQPFQAIISLTRRPAGYFSLRSFLPPLLLLPPSLPTSNTPVLNDFTLQTNPHSPNTNFLISVVGLSMEAPEESTAKPSLPIEIRAATRSHHSALNRLVASRLPLCLPPHAQSPRIYTDGIGIFAQIYFTFEEEWLPLLQEDNRSTTNHPNTRMTTLLRALLIPALLRREKLHHDLTILHAANHGRSSASSIETESFFRPFRSHIRTSIMQRPHVLFAYTWIMYMALFNGGRWIRHQLHDPGRDFWTTADTISAKDFACLSFWEFDSPNDGDDIQHDFKGRFHAAALQLTASEREQIIEEAVWIFEMCIDLERWLDAKNGSTLLQSSSWSDGIRQWMGEKLNAIAQLSTARLGSIAALSRRLVHVVTTSHLAGSR